MQDLILQPINFKSSEGSPRQDSFIEILLSKIGPSIQEYVKGLTDDQNLDIDGFWRFMQNLILQPVFFKSTEGSPRQDSFKEINTVQNQTISLGVMGKYWSPKFESLWFLDIYAKSDITAHLFQVDGKSLSR